MPNSRLFSTFSSLLMTIGVWMLGLFLPAGTLFAQPGQARAQLEQFSSGLESLAAGFEQRVIGTDGLVQAESQGRVWLQRPDRFRWEYQGDFPEIVIADGTTVWMYDEMLEQLTLRSQDEMTGNSPLTLLTDLAALDAQFDVMERGGDEELQILELQARSAESEFERVLLGFNEGELLLMAMEDAFGLRTEIRFHDIERNVQPDSTLFEFKVPPGTDVIGGPLPGTGDG